MFIEVHNTTTANTENTIKLAFVKSLNVQAYPCGRRRSEAIGTGDGKYSIPFDPEARLNTEANNTKISGLNGLTQTYLKRFTTDEVIDDANVLSVVLGGYLFNIKLADGYRSIDRFCTKLAVAEKLGTGTTKIYANIIIKETTLFKGFTEYTTGILYSQSDKSLNVDCLDLLITGGKSEQSTESANYYFSGLSFSNSPLSGNTDTTAVESYVEGKLARRTISICLFEKNGDTWNIYQPALLPKIEHGSTEESVKINTLFASELRQEVTDTQTGAVISNTSIPSLKLHKNDDDTYQLQFSLVDIE
jgi:hypothetical protein